MLIAYFKISILKILKHQLSSICFQISIIKLIFAYSVYNSILKLHFMKLQTKRKRTAQNWGRFSLRFKNQGSYEYYGSRSHENRERQKSIEKSCTSHCARKQTTSAETETL